MCKSLILFFLLTILFSQKACAEEFMQLPAAIQMSSMVSDGKLYIKEIAEIAKQNNIKVVVITDQDLRRFDYGLWPLRNILRKVVKLPSIFKYGINRYLKDIEEAQKDNPGLVLIPGAESAPFYYWEGGLFSRVFKLNDYYKHMLLIGLNEPGDYRNLPLVGNKRALALPFSLKCIFYLWPLLIVIAGVKLVPGARVNTRAFLILTGLLFLLNNFPFRDYKFDQYHGNIGIMPFQNLIEYVKERGGLTFWAHPEAQNAEEAGGVEIETGEYSTDLLRADNYTGFALFYEGYKKVGVAGGIWDETLKGYCRGQRKAPVWAIAGLSFDISGDLSERLKELKTVLLTRALSKDEAMGALREGRVYLVSGKGASHFVLDKFMARDYLTGTERFMGQELGYSDKPELEIKGHFENGESRLFAIRIIRDGEIIATLQENSPFDISYRDEEARGSKKSYYRLEIKSSELTVITNPIFAKGAK